MKILLVYPEFPDTFWGFRHALKFISKKASFPPLGLLTIAAMLPAEWEKRLIDMNVNQLKDKDIKWADYVFISAMSIQKKSVLNVISRCKKLGVKIVAGGPLFTAWFDEFDDVDYLVLNEAEIRPCERAGQAYIYVDRVGGYKNYPRSALGAYRYEQVRVNEHPVFPRMPVQLRIL
jgi:radical SAM superfamily enzyme YgiQ (UPF0313 family)